MTGKLLVFGASGLCGKAVVEQAILDDENSKILEVYAFCRDPNRLKETIASRGKLNKAQQQAIHYITGDVTNPDTIQAALERVRKLDNGTHEGTKDDEEIVIVNCLSSYTPPYTQISDLVRHISNLNFQGRFIHCGYPLAFIENASSPSERCMTSLSGVVSHRLRMAMKDHIRVATLLESPACSNLKDYMLVGLPLMLDKPSMGAFYGGAEAEHPDGHSATEAIAKHSLFQYSNSTIDFAKLVECYARVAIVQNQKLPKYTCLTYKR